MSDIYFAEFMRISDMLSYQNLQFLKTEDKSKAASLGLYLDPTDKWTQKYFDKGSTRSRERMIFSASI